MSTIFHDWCNRNEARNYPLKDGATKLSTTGVELPDDFIVDANIWFPASAGTGLMVSSASISPGLISVTFVAYGGGSPVPICAVYVAKPVEKYRKYSVDAFYPGVGGWVAFGLAVDADQNFALIFDSLAATELAPKATRTYDDLPLLSMGKKDFTAAFTGLIGLRAVDAVEVLACTDPWPPLGDPDFLSNPRYQRFVDGQPRDCIVLRLKGTPGDYENLYTYTGPCDKAPEDDQCGRRLIQKIAGVGADCNGNIDIIFQNIPTAYLEDALGNIVGMTLEYPLGTIDVCDPTRGLVIPPRQDLCVGSLSSIGSSMSMFSLSSVSHSSLPPLSSVVDPCAIITPFIDEFDSLSPCWTSVGGTWGIGVCQLNGLTTAGWGAIVRERTHTFGHIMKVQMLIRATSVIQRGYMIFGYRSVGGTRYYWFFELDATANRLLIGRRAGPVTVIESLPVTMTINPNIYYEVEVHVAAFTGAITTFVNGLPGPSVTPVAGTLVDGLVGLATRNSNVEFDNFRIDYPGLPPAPGCGTSMSSSSVSSVSSV